MIGCMYSQEGLGASTLREQLSHHDYILFVSLRCSEHLCTFVRVYGIDMGKMAQSKPLLEISRVPQSFRIRKLLNAGIGRMIWHSWK